METKGVPVAGSTGRPRPRRGRGAGLRRWVALVGGVVVLVASSVVVAGGTSSAAASGFTAKGMWLNWCGDDVRLADWDADGDADLLCSTGEHGMDEYRALSHRSGFRPYPTPLRWCGSTKVHGDFDGDGRTDLACRHGEQANLDVALANPESPTGWTHRGKWASGWCTAKSAVLQAADIDGDGRDDLLCADGGSKDVALSTGRAFETEGGAWANWCGADVRLADVDGVGGAELVCVSEVKGGERNLYVAKADAEDERFVPQSGNLSWCSDEVDFGDFDGDGRDDLSCRADGNVWIAKAKAPSDGLGWTPQSGARIEDWCTGQDAELHTGDITGDGSADLLCVDGSAKSVAVSRDVFDPDARAAQFAKSYSAGVTPKKSVSDVEGMLNLAKVSDGGTGRLLVDGYVDGKVASGPVSVQIRIGGETVATVRADAPGPGLRGFAFRWASGEDAADLLPANRNVSLEARIVGGQELKTPDPDGQYLHCVDDLRCGSTGAGEQMDQEESGLWVQLRWSKEGGFLTEDEFWDYDRKDDTRSIVLTSSCGSSTWPDSVYEYRKDDDSDADRLWWINEDFHGYSAPRSMRAVIPDGVPRSGNWVDCERDYGPRDEIARQVLQAELTDRLSKLPMPAGGDGDDRPPVLDAGLVEDLAAVNWHIGPKTIADYQAEAAAAQRELAEYLSAAHFFPSKGGGADRDVIPRDPESGQVLPGLFAQSEDGRSVYLSPGELAPATEQPAYETTDEFVLSPSWLFASERKGLDDTVTVTGRPDHFVLRMKKSWWAGGKKPLFRTDCTLNVTGLSAATQNVVYDAVKGSSSGVAVDWLSMKPEERKAINNGIRQSALKKAGWGALVGAGWTYVDAFKSGTLKMSGTCKVDWKP